jgi:hypothetical protein
MAKPPSPKADALRAMREANYERATTAKPKVKQKTGRPPKRKTS